jgi:hypothetical protein
MTVAPRNPTAGDQGPVCRDTVWALKHTERDVFFGTANVDSLHQTGRLQVIDSALSTSNLTGLGIQETRWTGSGVYEGGDDDPLSFIYIYSGGDEPHRGVVFALRRCYKDSVMGWWPEGDRLLRVRLKGRQDNSGTLPMHPAQPP